MNVKTDLDFTFKDTTYLTHGIHSFPARFPPQIVSWTIDEFLTNDSPTKPKILDPMVGSGTTLLEAFLNGCIGFGIDKDPLARLVSKVKTTPLNADILENESMKLEKKITKDILSYRGENNKKVSTNGDEYSSLSLKDCEKPSWSNLDYWFYEKVIDELSLVRKRISQVKDKDLRDFFKVVFSACLVTKGKSSLVNAHDLAHSRPHRVYPDEEPDVLERFINELGRKIKTLNKFTRKVQEIQNCYGYLEAELIGDDAKDIDLEEKTIDLIVTSPPYINAIDYPRATKYSLFWLEWDEEDYKNHRDRYIGGERIKKENYMSWLNSSTESKIANEHIDNLKDEYPKMAGVIYKYTEDMSQVIKEMNRVLKKEGKSVVVVGDNNIRGEDVKTHQILCELAKNNGFCLLEKIPRKIGTNKRQLPVDRGENKNGMVNEWVLVFQK